MPKFKVMVHGENYRIAVVERNFLFRKNLIWKPVGFYTTRFVEAETANEAIKLVFDSIQNELQADGRTTDFSTIDLEVIQEIAELPNARTEKGGLIFYPDKE